ncbi:MAG: DUF2993 domain-containing protein [Candidatus Riflebacteria bacterium]|nr:DUF2993 domain-containing protein [Candidatus Riflebacteria bacterium]
MTFVILLTVFLTLFPCVSHAQNASPGAVILASWTPDPQISLSLKSNPILFKEKLENSMKKLLKNPASLSVFLTPYSDKDSSEGLFQKITINVTRGEYDNLVLERANTDFYDVQLNTTKLINEEKIDTVRVKKIDMDILILQNDLNAFLDAKSNSIGVRDPRIDMHPNNLVLSGSTKYGFMKVKFWATGNLKVHNAKAIWFHPKNIKLNGMPMPGAFLGTLTKRINPVLNLEKFPYQINLQNIITGDGFLQFTSNQTN